MDMREQIVKMMDSPRDLEALYRSNPDYFVNEFSEVFAKYSDSKVLQVWNERLFFKDMMGAQTSKIAHAWNKNEVFLIIVLSLFAGTLVKIPQFITSIKEQFFYPRNLSLIVFLSLATYFLFNKSHKKKNILGIITIFFVAVVFINLLPENNNSQTLILSCLHMPFFLWSLLGLAFLGNQWKISSERMNYIRYNGEVIIYTTIVLIGGTVLAGITFALFKLINVKIEEWYFKYVVVYGSVASPIVSTYVADRISGHRIRIASILAKLFSPLFLVTLIVYLLMIIVLQKSPYTDRDFLISFNILLLVVLALTVFSISERKVVDKIIFSDYVNLSLVFVTLVIDVVALSAILFRLASYGYTPNRIAVLGANIIVFCHLVGILYRYFHFLRRNSEFDKLETWITSYLPIYSMWTVVVTFGFPVIFWFK